MSKKPTSKQKVFKSGETAILLSKIPSDRRREWRLKLPLVVEVEGKLPKGKTFKEQTTIENISSSGAYFCLDSAITVGSKLNLIIEIPPDLTDGKNIKLKLGGSAVRLKKSTSGQKKQDVALSFDEKYSFIEEDQSSTE